MTFVGFAVDTEGQCLDFRSKEPIKDQRNVHKSKESNKGWYKSEESNEGEHNDNKSEISNIGQSNDSKSKESILKVPLKVCECLRTQGVNLQKEDCNKWTKYVKYVGALIILFDLLYFCKCFTWITVKSLCICISIYSMYVNFYFHIFTEET